MQEIRSVPLACMIPRIECGQHTELTSAASGACSVLQEIELSSLCFQRVDYGYRKIGSHMLSAYVHDFTGSGKGICMSAYLIIHLSSFVLSCLEDILPSTTNFDYLREFRLHLNLLMAPRT